MAKSRHFGAHCENGLIRALATSERCTDVSKPTIRKKNVVLNRVLGGGGVWGRERLFVRFGLVSKLRFLIVADSIAAHIIVEADVMVSYVSLPTHLHVTIHV